MRTKQEITDEIKALKSLEPIGLFKEKTTESITIQIEELEFGFDETAEEWNELSHEQLSCVMDAREWKKCRSKNRPSKEWAGLVK